MTKAGLVDAIYDRLGDITKNEAMEHLEAVFETIKQTLAAGTRVKISGFGNFSLRDKGERPGLNPQTREPLVLAARRIVRFRASPVLRTLVNTRLKP